MGYRKFRPDKVFNGHEILTGHTLITTEDGTVQQLLPDNAVEGEAEILQGILSPGFINCHCHLELSHMHGMIPERTGLVDFAITVVTERQAEKEVILGAIAKAEAEMISYGIVAVGDICNNPATLLQKFGKNLYYHNFVETSGFVPEGVAERFTRSVSLFNVFCELYKDPQASNSIVPHAPYSVATDLFRKITSFPGNRLLTMHNQESPEENELFQNKSGDFLRLYEQLKINHDFFKPAGTTSLQACLPYFFPNQTLILVHNVALAEEDLRYIEQQSTAELFFCLCPNANLYITGQLPPVDLLVNSNSRIVLGTDSLASNHQLSILEEIRTIKKNFDHLTYQQLLKWATFNGASALGIEQQFGSFEKGKKPGVILIDNGFEKVSRVI